MIKLLSEMIEDAESGNFAKSDKGINLTEIRDFEDSDSAITSINKTLLKVYKKCEDHISELLVNARNDLDTIYEICKDSPCFPNSVPVIVIAPLMGNSWHLAKCISDPDCNPICEIKSRYSDADKKLSELVLGELFRADTTTVLSKDNYCKSGKLLVSNISDNVNLAYEFYKHYSNIENIGIEDLKNFVAVMKYIVILSVGSYRAIDWIKCNLLKCHSQNESTEINNEYVDTYINELNKLIPELRDFYDTFKYKELVSPRYKKITKMHDYVLGALERRYSLKIPMYKILNATEDVRDIIENQFIKKLNAICHKYPNYILLTPNFGENSDMFIYVTLKEPFGKDGDRADRKIQSAQKRNPSDSENVINEKKLNEDAVTIAGVSLAGAASLYTLGQLASDDIEKKKDAGKMTSISRYKDLYCTTKLDPLKPIINSAVEFKVPVELKKILNLLLMSFNMDMKLLNATDKCLCGIDSLDTLESIKDEVLSSYESISWSDFCSHKLGKEVVSLTENGKYEIVTDPKRVDTIKKQLCCYIDKITNYKREIIVDEKHNPNIKFLNNLCKKAEADKSYIKEYENAYDRIVGILNRFDQHEFMRIYTFVFKHIQIRITPSNTKLVESALLEETLTAADRKNLPDEKFGIPSTRSYPLNDKEHIAKAIQMFKFAKPSQRKELADNIVKQIIKQDLVGTVMIGKDNKFKKWFPNWMAENNATCTKKNGKYTIYVNDETQEIGTLDESTCEIEFII